MRVRRDPGVEPSLCDHWRNRPACERPVATRETLALDDQHKEQTPAHGRPLPSGESRRQRMPDPRTRRSSNAGVTG
jgi:hypothetical protein